LNLSENSFDVSGLVNVGTPKQTSVLNILRAQLERSFFVSSHVGLNVGSGGESGHTNLDNVAVLMVIELCPL